MSRQSGNILITGCSSGIGRYSALELHKAGFTVIASVRTNEQRADLEQQGVATVVMELADASSIARGFAQAMEKFNGRLDYLFNNAAYGQCGAVEDITTEVLRQQFEVNFFAWHDLTKRAIAVMRTQNSGRIIQNSSVLGFVALAYRGAYNASKFALEGLTDTLRLELHGSGIKVILIEPGPIASRFRQNALKAFQQNIDTQDSIHKKNYALEINRLQAKKSTSPFVLEPDAVYRKLYHAITAKKPKIRYFVTRPTYLMAWCKRLFPVALLDRVLLKGS